MLSKRKSSRPEAHKSLCCRRNLASPWTPIPRKTDAFFQSLADKTKSQIVVGLIRVSPPVKYNEARVYAPGALLQSYDKHHMLPPFESNLKPGTKLTFLREPSGTWGVAICKDMDFTPLSRQYGKAGAASCSCPRGISSWIGGGMAISQ